MQFSDEEIQEFKIEASELLNEAENSLLMVEKGEDFKKHYDSIFRAFHSLKGAAGMLEINELQNHMHTIENHFQGFKAQTTISGPLITYFLKSIDSARTLLDGQSIRFDYTLPADNGSSGIVPESAQPSKVSEALVQKNVIFVIDDEEDLVEIIGSMLEKFSFPWKGYTDPAVAVADFEKHDPILVLSDMKMPKLTGLDVLARAKEYNPDLPVIFISSHLDKETLIEAMSLGIYGVIEKPFKELNVISQVNLSLKHTKMWQLLNRSIDMILFQLQDLEQFLISKGKKDVAQILRSDVEGLLMAKRGLKSRTAKRP